MKNKQVILLMSDTTRKDMIGYFNPAMHTPNIDSLAREGLAFENAYSCQPVCGPARSAIFTGQSPHSNGMVTNSVALGENIKTIGQRLSDNGIHTGYVGKYHLDGGDYFGLGKCPDGWDEDYWFDQKCYLNQLTSDIERIKSRQSDTSYEEWLTEEFTFAHKTSEIALDFLENNVDTDFFLTVSFDEPHGPSICPTPYNTMYKDFKFEHHDNFNDDLNDKPLFQRLWSGEDIGKTEDELNKPSKGLALFLGCNSFMDYEIGRLMKKIDKYFPDALIIYTSDHGDMLGSHKLQMKNAAAYKEIANIPLIIRGGVKGKVTDAMASHIDLAPTILDYMGISIPKILEGESMLPQIFGEKEEINKVVYTEWTRYEVDHDGFGGLQMMRAATSKKYKLVINLMDKDEFYDLVADPFEVKNLIEDCNYNIHRNKLHDELLQHMNDSRDPYRGYQWAARVWRKDKKPTWTNDGYTRQRENEEYEPRQLDYDTGLPMDKAVRLKTTNDVKN
jgi:uncharacterized sulfatase